LLDRKQWLSGEDNGLGETSAFFRVNVTEDANLNIADWNYLTACFLEVPSYMYNVRNSKKESWKIIQRLRFNCGTNITQEKSACTTQN